MFQDAEQAARLLGVRSTASAVSCDRQPRAGDEAKAGTNGRQLCASQVAAMLMIGLRIRGE